MTSTVLMLRCLPLYQTFTTANAAVKLLDIIPKPVKAVILLFPLSVDIEMKRREEDARIKADGPGNVHPATLFIKQTVSCASVCRNPQT